MFTGSIVALITPMQEGGEIDFKALESLIAMHIQCKTSALVIGASTGEGNLLSSDELQELIKRSLEFANDQIPIIAATGYPSTKYVIEQTRLAMQAGVDACMIVTPAYVRPPQRGLVQHYRAIAEAVPIPIILYNVPSRTACDMLPETIAEIAEIPNIIGLKEASPDPKRILDLVKLGINKKLTILSGNDEMALQSILEGAKGTISVAANLLPALVQSMCTAALAGKHQEALDINQRLSGIYQTCGYEPNPIAMKWMMAEQNLVKPYLRLPLMTLASKYHDQARQALIQAGVL